MFSESNEQNLKTKKISIMKIAEHIINVYLMASEIESLRNTLLSQGYNIDLNLYNIYKSKKLIYDNYIHSLTTKN